MIQKIIFILVFLSVSLFSFSKNNEYLKLYCKFELKNDYASQVELDTIINKKSKIKVSDFFNLINDSSKKSSREDNYLPFDEYISFSDTIIISPIFIPVIFDGKLLPENLDFYNKDKLTLGDNDLTYKLIKSSDIVGSSHAYSETSTDNLSQSRYKLIDEKDTLSKYIKEKKAIQNIRKYYYVNNPELISYNSKDLTFDLPESVTTQYKNRPLQILIAPESSKIIAPNLKSVDTRQRYWRVNMKNNLDISQRHFTENWANKGNGVSQLSSLQRVDFLYRRNKIEFTQWTEWRLDLNRLSLTQEEKENNKSVFFLNEDYVRSYNKLALDAFIKKWSYIITVDLKTPIFNKRSRDDKSKIIASFISPFELNVGVGASFSSTWTSKSKPSRTSKFVVDATPLSLQTLIVKNDKVWENNNYGVVYPDDTSIRRYSKTSFGSTIVATFDYKINNFTNFYSRNKFFTNYHRALFECENTLNFRLNRFLSTRLYYYLIFDDGIDISKKDPTWKYFSFTDEIRFGMNLSW